MLFVCIREGWAYLSMINRSYNPIVLVCDEDRQNSNFIAETRVSKNSKKAPKIHEILIPEYMDF